MSNIVGYSPTLVAAAFPTLQTPMDLVMLSMFQQIKFRLHNATSCRVEVWSFTARSDIPAAWASFGAFLAQEYTLGTMLPQFGRTIMSLTDIPQVPGEGSLIRRYFKVKKLKGYHLRVGGRQEINLGFRFKRPRIFRKQKESDHAADYRYYAGNRIIMFRVMGDPGIPILPGAPPPVAFNNISYTQPSVSCTLSTWYSHGGMPISYNGVNYGGPYTANLVDPAAIPISAVTSNQASDASAGPNIGLNMPTVPIPLTT